MMTSYYRPSISGLPEMGLVGKQLWAQSGLGRDDVQAAILYDHVAPFVLPQLEELGFCGRGEARHGTARGETIAAGAGNDVVCAGDGNDVVKGGDGNDALGGGAGRDTLVGAAGGDKLAGGTGWDYCYGGVGSDTSTGCEQRAGIP